MDKLNLILIEKGLIIHFVKQDINKKIEKNISKYGRDFVFVTNVENVYIYREAQKIDNKVDEDYRYRITK